MNFKTIHPDKSISLFVKNILVFEEPGKKHRTVLPFFADGYPGIIFQETEHGLFVSPHNKEMPLFFLYGQTLAPLNCTSRVVTSSSFFNCIHLFLSVFLISPISTIKFAFDIG